MTAVQRHWPVVSRRSSWTMSSRIMSRCHSGTKDTARMPPLETYSGHARGAGSRALPPRTRAGAAGGRSAGRECCVLCDEHTGNFHMEMAPGTPRSVKGIKPSRRCCSCLSNRPTPVRVLPTTIHRGTRTTCSSPQGSRAQQARLPPLSSRTDGEAVTKTRVHRYRADTEGIF